MITIGLKWMENNMKPSCPRNVDPESRSENKKFVLGRPICPTNQNPQIALNVYASTVSAGEGGSGEGEGRGRNIIIIIWLISPRFPRDLLFCEGVTESKEDWHDYSTSFALTPFLHLLCLLFSHPLPTCSGRTLDQGIAWAPPAGTLTIPNRISHKRTGREGQLFFFFLLELKTEQTKVHVCTRFRFVFWWWWNPPPPNWASFFVCM